MAVFNEPTQWDHTLGNNADTSTLPDDAVATAGIASLQKLFQIINATPLEAGGIAPGREDVNALFKYLGDSIFYTMNGGIPSYNAAYDYIAGRVVLYNGNLYKCIQANGASSTVVAPDSVSPLGSDYWVQVATLADFTNFADKDFSNVTAPVQAFKSMSIGWGMPDYSAGVSKSENTIYTAEKNGWLYAYRGSSAGSSTAHGTIEIDDVSLRFQYFNAPYGLSTAGMFVPIAKGSKYKFSNCDTKTYFPCRE